MTGVHLTLVTHCVVLFFFFLIFISIVRSLLLIIVSYLDKKKKKKTMLIKSSYIVDFQGWKNGDEEIKDLPWFVMKEFAVVGIHNNLIVHCVTKPPSNMKFIDIPDLSFFKQNVKFCTRFIHGLRWDDGYMPLEDAYQMLKDILRDADTIYCKGSERCMYLSQLLARTVLDLDCLDCPKANQWPPYPGNQVQLLLTCPYRSHQPGCCQNEHNISRYRRCALHSALKYRDWYQRCYSTNRPN